MKASERVPSVAGLALKLGAATIVYSGTCWWTFDQSGRMNMLRANRLCHANSLMTRIGLWEKGVGASETVPHEQVPALQVPQHPLLQAVELLRLHRTIHRSPPNVFFARRLSHHELVVWRAGGVFAGADHA